MISRQAIFVFLVLAGASFLSCTRSKELAPDVIFVRIPPFYDAKLSPGENQCVFSGFLFPNAYTPDVVRNCTDSGLANDDSLLYVSLEEDGSLRVNMQPISDNRQLTEKLAQLFQEREKNGVFEPGSDRVIKAVGIHAPDSVTYADFITVAQAVKESGARPIVLLLDGHLPEMLIESPDREK